MRHTISYQFGGITIQTDSDIPLNLDIHSVLDPYRVSPRELTHDQAHIRHHIHVYETDALPLPPPDERERDCLMRTVGFPRRWLEKPILCSSYVRRRLRIPLQTPEQIFVDLRWNRAIIRNYARNQLDVLYPRDRQADLQGELFFAAYRNLSADFFLNFDAALLHAAGVILDNRAAIFFAPDEGGKTTIVRHARDVPVLNDDHVLLSWNDGQMWAHSTPFGRITSGPAKAALGGVFLLEKAPTFELTPLQPPHVMRYLWYEHKRYWFRLPHTLRTNAFQLLSTIAYQSSLYRLRFPEDYVDWAAVRRAITSPG